MMASSTSTTTSHTIAGRRWLWRLLFTLAAVQSLAHCLPITSRPLEGNAQRLAWQEWLDLPKDQKTPEKKVTAKSIFTLPFRRCPPGHKLYNERCIPQTNIDPEDVLKQELILAGGGGAGGPGNGGSPVIITDYDYGDEDEFSDELLYDAPQQQPLMQTTGGEDQALPSEDAPLKFNLFEKKFPTGTGTGTDTTEQESLDDMLMLPPEMNATATINGNATATTTTAATFIKQATPTASVATTPRQAEGINNAIAQGDDLLQAASSNNVISSTTTTLRDIDISSIEAIVVPAGHRTTSTNIEPEAQSVQLVTSSLSPDADAETDANLSSSSTPLQTEADLAQLLKVDAFLPASTSRSNIEMLPAPYSNHRRVAPLLTAEELGEETTTDMVTTTQEDEGETKTEKEMETQTETEREMATETETETEVEAVETTETTPTTMDEPENHLVLIKSKVQPVQLTQTTSAATATATATATTTTTEAVATDRFHYQHFEDVAASNSATSASSILPENEAEVKTGNSNNNHNNNIMTNTIASQHDDDDDDDENDKTSEINLAEELRIINELVKSKKRHQPQQSTAAAAAATTRITTATIIESSTETTGTTTSTTESSTFIETEMEMATETAATISNNADSSSSSSSSATTTPTAAAATTTTTTTTATQLSINTNRSNKNSKIIRVNNEYESTSKAATVATVAAAATPISSSNISSSDGYTPFWWLPNIGWRLDRQVDRHGEDRSLLLRFFSTFRAPSTGESRKFALI